jgi:hypothetical protein
VGSATKVPESHISAQLLQTAPAKAHQGEWCAAVESSSCLSLRLRGEARRSKAHPLALCEHMPAAMPVLRMQQQENLMS